MSSTAPIYDIGEKIWYQPLEKPTLKIGLGQFILNRLDEFDPNKIIEINYDNDKKLNAAELKKLVLNCAKNFTELRIKQNDRIALFSTMNSYTTPIVYGAYVIGAAITPMDTLLNDDILEKIFKKLDPNVIIYDEEYKDRVLNIMQNLKFTNLKLTLSSDSEIECNSVPNLICKDVNSNFEIPTFSNPDEVLGAILLTSGSTGLPKQKMLSHSQLALVVNTWWPGNEPSNIYIASPFRWVSQFSAMLQPIFNKSTRIFSRKHHSGELCFDVIQKYRVTHFFAVTNLITSLLEYSKKKEGQHLETIRYIMTSGERIPECIEKYIHEYIPKAYFIRVYGMTEIAGVLSSNFYVKDKFHGPTYIVPGLSLKIIDDENNSLGSNCNGRICVKTVVPFLGYWDDREANQKSFLNKWFITGDYGKMDSENKLYVYNRYKDLIMFEKKTIVPSIIEQILESHPAVYGCCVIGVPISKEKKTAVPVAFIRLKQESITKNDILEFLKNNLLNEGYPKHIYFIKEFPLVTCGKIDKNKLKDLIKMDMVLDKE